MKICFLTNILAPYRIGLFESLAKKVDELTVILMAGGHDNRLWQIPEHTFATTVLHGLHVSVPGFEEPFHLNTDVWSALERINPDVIISGGYTVANVSAYLFCRRRRKLHVSWGELTLMDGAHKSLIRRLLRRWLISRSDAVIASSTVAKTAFEYYGARHDRTMLSVMPIDVDAFREQSEAFRCSSGFSMLRAQYGSGPCLISVGRLIDIKGYPELFDIYRQLLEHYPSATLLIAGDGAERSTYESLVSRAGWTRVHFLGFVQAAELVKYLCISDLFVFHTRYDPFGAVLSEAMACGTPVVTSIHAAATHDLVEDGVSGYVIDPAAIQEAVAKICRALSLTQAQRLDMTMSAYRSVKAWDFEAASTAIGQLAESLLVQPSLMHREPIEKT